MMVTYDEQFLLSVSEDGCLLMWKLMDEDGRGLKVTRQIVHAEEILVTKADLEEKVRRCSSGTFLGPCRLYLRVLACVTRTRT